MEVSVKLMGMYRDRQPPSGRLELPDPACIRDILKALDIPDSHIQIVSINDRLEKDLDQSVASEDEVTILPTVTGG